MPSSSPVSDSQGRRKFNSNVASDFMPRTAHRTRAPSNSSQRKTRRQTVKHHAHSSANAAALYKDPLTCAQPARSRHIRHGQPPSRQTRVADHSSTPHDVAIRDRPASLPPSSPAKDLLRRARATADVDTDWRGRRPFIMDVILGNRPAGSQRREEGVLDAIELCEAALGPVVGGVYHLEDARSLESYWEAQAARSRLTAGDTAQHVPVPAYQVSAERSTVTWPGDEDAGAPPSGNDSSPSVGTPQHMHAGVQGAVEPADLVAGGMVRSAY